METPVYCKCKIYLMGPLRCKGGYHTTRAIYSWLLFSKERQDPFVHDHSFLKSDESERAMSERSKERIHNSDKNRQNRVFDG